MNTFSDDRETAFAHTFTHTFTHRFTHRFTHTHTILLQHFRQKTGSQSSSRLNAHKHFAERNTRQISAAHITAGQTHWTH